MYTVQGLTQFRLLRDIDVRAMKHTKRYRNKRRKIIHFYLRIYGTVPSAVRHAAADGFRAPANAWIESYARLLLR
jgi:hypothetical protein